MYFRFKEQAEDFIVTELLQAPITQSGDYFFVLREKRERNTMEILETLCQHFSLKREHLGITGLKDKQGITRQRLSIHTSKLKTCGGQSAFLDFLHSQVKILSTGRNDQPLHIWKNAGNNFNITLKRKQELPPHLKLQLEEALEKSKKFWFPNAFWIQRFGKGFKNYKKAQHIFESKVHGQGNYEVKFKLQAFWNMRCNEQIMQRREQNAFLLDGDIMINGRNAFGSKVAKYEWGKLHHFDYRAEKKTINGKATREASSYLRSSDYNPQLRIPSALVLGSEQLLASAQSPAGQRDLKILKSSNFLHNGHKISKHYQIYGFRRPISAHIYDLERNRTPNWDLQLQFSLPTGAYASIFLARILQNIDPHGCIANSLIIPRPSQI